MRWIDVRRLYPDRWVVVSVQEAETEIDRRYGRDWTPLAEHTDADAALRNYVAVRREQPDLELELVHTHEYQPIDQVSRCTACGVYHRGGSGMWCETCIKEFRRKGWIARERKWFLRRRHWFDNDR